MRRWTKRTRWTRQLEGCVGSGEPAQGSERRAFADRRRGAHSRFLRFAFPLPALLALAVATVGCGEEGPECVSTGDCDIGELCIDERCESAPLRDGGTNEDGGGVGGGDGGVDAGGEAGTDAGSCPAACGDVDGDGDTDGDDLARLTAIVDGTDTASVCEQAAGDLDGSGAIDAFDQSLIPLLFDGSVTGGCEPCTRSCGDANDDGTVNVSDVTAAIARIEEGSALSVCEWVALDTDGNGRVDESDARVIGRMITETVTDSCAGCASDCGDVNGDGMVSLADINRIGLLASGEETPTACELWTADTDGDGELSRRDAQLVFQTVATAGTSVVPGMCTPCVRSCGDVNDDGEVNGADASALAGFLAGSATATACDYVGADVKRDGEITEADRQALARLRLDPTLGACDARCELACGDVDGVEGLGSADAVRVAAHLDGSDPFTDVCALWAADVDGDGAVSEADRDAIFDTFASAGTSEDLSCTD